MQQKGVESDLITYSAANSACGKAKQLGKAMKLLAEMRQKGLAPDVITFNAVVCACGKAKQPD